MEKKLEYKKEWQTKCTTCNHPRGDHGANDAACMKQDCICRLYQKPWSQ